MACKLHAHKTKPLSHKPASHRSCCPTTPLLSCPLEDLEILFGKHGSQLSEMFWEGLEQFLEMRESMVTSNVQSLSFLRSRAEMYAKVIAEKREALGNCVGFIDAIVVGIARPGEEAIRREVYNGHKRRHALKYQAVTTPDGLIANFFGPAVGRRHNWWMFAKSGSDEVLGTVPSIGDKQYVIYRDSGYNHRSYLEVPFDGANLGPGQIQFNRAMSSVRITVE